MHIAERLYRFCQCGLVLSLVMSGCGQSETSDTRAAAPVSVPECSAAVADTSDPQAPAAQHALDGAPFGVAAAPDGGTVFVALNAADATQPGALVALDAASGEVIGKVSVGPEGNAPQVMAGSTLTHDGRLVLVAIGDGVAVFDAALVRTSAPEARVGTLHAANEAGTIHVAVSPDDRYVAATEEHGGSVTLFDLEAAIADGFTQDSGVASIQVNQLPVGVAFTPDGDSLVVTSQTSAAPSAQPTPGTLSLIDVRSAIAGKGEVVRAVVPAGCNPVRLAIAPDGDTVWVTARSSNALLAFDIARLKTEPKNALLGWVRVGPAPVGVTLSDAGTVAVVANSNRFDAPNSPSTITVVDTASVLAGDGRIVANFRSGGFPREVATTSAGVAFVTDFGTMQLTVIDPLPTP